MQPVLEAIMARRSAPRLLDPAPDQGQLRSILLAGIHAPDHGRLQPWRFVIIAGDKRALLGEAMARVKKRLDPGASVEALQSERAKPLRAPLIIVVAARPTVGHKVPVAEQVAAVSACVQNMSLAAAALGFAANWKTGPAAEAEEVKDTLGLATDDTIVALLYLGTPDGTPPPYEPTLDGRVSIL